jgi:hypothetical protein
MPQALALYWRARRRYNKATERRRKSAALAAHLIEDPKEIPKSKDPIAWPRTGPDPKNYP